MNIKDLQAEVHEIAIQKGFWPEDEKRNIGEMIALCHEELSEALREIRQGHDPKLIYYSGNVRPGIEVRSGQAILSELLNGPIKPEGFPIELADTIIRILDMAEGLGIDLEGAIKLKLVYNKVREHRHGKKF